MKVVALHGYPLDGRLFAPLATALTGHLEVLAPDFRGRRTASRPALPMHTMAQLADDVTEDLPGLTGGEPFLLGGLSMGGYVVLELLRRHRRSPALSGLRGIVLMDTRASEDDASTREKREAARAAIAQEGMASALHAMLPNLLGANARGGPAEAVVRSMILETPRDAARADLAGMAARTGSWDVLVALDLPLLVLVGEEDAITPPRDAEAIAESAPAAPRVSLATVPAAGHLAPLEEPAECARILREFAGFASRRGG
ncbi:MAG: alpha/beta fold hydrolase [Acidobacteria bacterium]|nr:alpha/beta fold hydrolase [Acidobacteriota bacterium]